MGGWQEEGRWEVCQGRERGGTGNVLFLQIQNLHEGHFALMQRLIFCTSYSVTWGKGIKGRW